MTQQRCREKSTAALRYVKVFSLRRRQARGDSAPRCAAERCAESSTKGSLKLALPLVSRGRQLGAASNFDRRTRGGGCVV